MVDLDQQQRQAVTTDSRRGLVLAGAGSGKTRVLTERIAHLIENEKVSPFEVLSFTFTRKASQEMKSRLEDRIGHQANKVTMATMHAIALQMIHRFGDVIGLKSKGVTVYSEWEESYLLKEVATEMGVFKKTWKIPKKEINQMFADYYQQGIIPDKDRPGHDLFQAFIGRMKENNALSYGALLIGFELLIPTLAKHLHYRHILVDEVQDIDLLQWNIIERLTEAFNASLFVVGDISQSIYEWRGAAPDYLLDHGHLFDIYRLETNYRSREPIVTAANRLIEHNEMRLPLEMRSIKETDGPSWENPVIKVVKNQDSKRLIDALSVKMENTAILCRVHAPLAKLSQLLDGAGIEHTYIGKKTALTNSEEFRRFHAFLKLIVNPYDNFAFLLIRELMGISRKHYSEIRVEAAESGYSHFQVYQNKKGGNDFATLCRPGSFEHTILNIQSIIEDPTDPEFDCSEIVQFCLDNKQKDIQSYLDWLATVDLQDEISDSNDGLQLMTIHAAKGLEWQTVIIAGTNEGLLPSKQAINNDEIESERRLAYVAWTRAEERLILTVRPETREYNGKIYHNPISRFIKESGI